MTHGWGHLGKKKKGAVPGAACWQGKAGQPLGTDGRTDVRLDAKIDLWCFVTSHAQARQSIDAAETSRVNLSWWLGANAMQGKKI